MHTTSTNVSSAVSLLPSKKALQYLNIPHVKQLHFQLNTAELTEHALINQEGYLTDTGALMCSTGSFTGRSPKDRFIVKDDLTADQVNWNAVNIPFSEANFDSLHDKMKKFAANQQAYVRYANVNSDSRYQLNLCILTTSAWQNLFCVNMFLRPTQEEIQNFAPNFTILALPEFEADPAVDATRGTNFTILNLSKRIILIGGTAYAGEIKKGIFSALNFLLPKQGVFPMHCSANIGTEAIHGNTDVALFFGLSGTGKTTLSADPERGLIGDDEHGWSDQGVFNFEGGCYAKVANLKRANEEQIFDAIRFGALVENTCFHEGTRTVDYTNISRTENTRTSYPIDYIDNAVTPSVGGHPKNIFFLTCDAFGVLPPISKLTTEQAMDYFMLGYTAKVAGTEMGITEPQVTFSACFGAAFMPLSTKEYAAMLGEKVQTHQSHVWLINTGWTGGSYGTGSRMKLGYTRAMIRAALTGNFNQITFTEHPHFALAIPTSCPGVPDEVLNPRLTWSDKGAYDQKAQELNQLFIEKKKTFIQ